MTGRSRSCGSAVELLEHLEAVHLRHLDVEQQQVERLASQHLQRDAAVLGERDAMPQQLEAARQQQPVDLVVVDDQQAGTVASAIAQGLQFGARHARIPLPARRAAASRPAIGVQAARARARAPARPASVAPNVLPFDLSECAARRKRSALPVGERARAAPRACRRLLEERVDQLDARTRRRRCPRSSAKQPRSIDRLRPCHRSSCAPARASSASTSARRGSAWSGSRPCPRPGTARGRPASRWRSSRRCAGARRRASAR